MPESSPSARASELLERAYAYVLTNGLSDLSLRPLSAAIGSSPRVLLYLFGSKHDLVRALLGRARRDELEMLRSVQEANESIDMIDIGLRLWSWLVDEAHRNVLVLWAEVYAQSVAHPDGPWTDFAATTVQDWLDLLEAAGLPTGAEPTASATAVLAVLRGCLLDLLATGAVDRTTAAVETTLLALRWDSAAQMFGK